MFQFVCFQAIEALQTAARSNPTGALAMLLGKTQMKAKRFKDAVVTFDNALELFVSISNRYTVKCNSYQCPGAVCKYLKQIHSEM